MRILPELLLDALHGSHIVLAFLFWAVRVGQRAGCLLNFTCLLHKFIENVVFEDCVVQELEIFKIFDCVLLACATNRLGQESSGVPGRLKLLIAAQHGILACFRASGRP